jgi:hypothetical protein
VFPAFGDCATDAYIAPILAGKWLNGQFFSQNDLAAFATIAAISTGTFRVINIVSRFLADPFDEFDHVGMGDQFVGMIEVARKGGFVKQVVDHAMADTMQPFGFRAAL